jgi:phage-related protein
VDATTKIYVTAVWDPADQDPMHAYVRAGDGSNQAALAGLNTVWHAWAATDPTCQATYGKVIAGKTLPVLVIHAGTKLLEIDPLPANPAAIADAVRKYRRAS